MSAMDTDNYRSPMGVMLLLTFQDSAQFHFGNLVFAMLDPFVECNVECSAATKLSFLKQLFLFVEVSLLLAFSHTSAALYFAHCTVQYTVAPKLSQLSSQAALPCPHRSGAIAKPYLRTFAEHAAPSKLPGPDLGTLANLVQVDTNVMLLPAFPYVDRTIRASHRYYKGSLGQ